MQLVEGKYKTSVYRNKKLPTHWSSKIPKKIKRNIIRNDLHRAKVISTVFEEEISAIREKYKKAGYPSRFVESVIRTFQEEKRDSSTNEEHEEQVNQAEQTEEEKPFLPIRLPFCEKNETVAKNFINKLKEFTGNSFKLNIVWQTKKIKSLCSKLKDEVKHKANIIYKGTSVNNPEETYIGETKQIAEERWKQHENPAHDSAPAMYLREHPDDKFEWEILSPSYSNGFRRKIHEALFIRKQRPSLNRQVQHRKLILFREGVT